MTALPPSRLPPAKGPQPLNIVIFGLSITSSWGNGHATTYRGLIHALHRRGHRVRFFERDMPWYAGHRDLASPPYCSVELYSNLEELERNVAEFERADVVIVGSYVPEGRRLTEWLLPRVGGTKVFYDIDTPVTLAALANDTCEYLDRKRVPDFDLYLSFSGGPILERLRAQFGASRPCAFYCSVEPSEYFPIAAAVKHYDLGYLGTYSTDRQPALDRLLLEPARRWPEGLFYVAGAQYPQTIQWPANVERAQHLPPAKHRSFYNHQRFTLNVTRADMVASGYSPSVRLFEAAACGVPIITDPWAGLQEFFEPGREILVAQSTAEVLEMLHDTRETELRKIGARALQRVLAYHTADHRAQELERHVHELGGGSHASVDRRPSHASHAGVAAV
jgi:spore maturation protein CgeB